MPMISNGWAELQAFILRDVGVVAHAMGALALAWMAVGARVEAGMRIGVVRSVWMVASVSA